MTFQNLRPTDWKSPREKKNIPHLSQLVCLWISFLWSPCRINILNIFYMKNILYIYKSEKSKTLGNVQLTWVKKSFVDQKLRNYKRGGKNQELLPSITGP